MGEFDIFIISWIIPFRSFPLDHAPLEDALVVAASGDDESVIKSELDIGDM